MKTIVKRTKHQNISFLISLILLCNIGISLLEVLSVESLASTEVSSSDLPKLKLEQGNFALGTTIHDQAEISASQMEAYMAGNGTATTKTVAEDRITGSMTAAAYKETYGTLNEEQNKAWNDTYKFKPETKVKRVSDWESFRAAFTDNTVSKIILEKNIYYGTTTAIGRSESLEIDGQGYLLEMINGSLNLDDLKRIEDFGKAFSAVPVFHIHDIQIANNTGYGALEGNLVNAWSFINGRGQRGIGGSESDARTKLWRYRMGNIYTPYDTSKKNTNQRVGGRLINANRAEISIWGHNTIVTGAENFYTGGITYEPFSFYKGTNAYYDYSVIWFMDNSNLNDANGTATRKFDIGEGSFVYLNYTNNGLSYPGVFSNWDELRVRKKATYNVSTPGTSVYFNTDNGKFIGEEESTVNLLSRAGGRPTLSLNGFHPLHGGKINPVNTSFEMRPQSKLFIVGNHNNGVISYGNIPSKEAKIIIDSPELFDIRNTNTATTTANAFLGDNTNTSNRGQNSFVIKNSDISLWNNTAQIDGAPTYDYTDVKDFKVTTTTVNGGITSSDTNLASQYTRPKFKRISGMNSLPKLLWLPVTDADYGQKALVLLGYSPVGGSNPFDDNGEAIVKPMYADNIRKAYVDYTDTLGNTYTGVSSADNYVHWPKSQHKLPGFQLKDQNMKGIPFRATTSNNQLIPYRLGKEEVTPVLDVTPPEPVVLTNPAISSATTKINGSGEPNAKLTVKLNDKLLPSGNQRVASDGSWQIEVAKDSLKNNDVLQFFLEDNAPLLTTLTEPPTTNSRTGNINPSKDLPYRDALFKEGTRIVVQGRLELTSVPSSVDFGYLGLLDYRTIVGIAPTSLANGLVVSDTRNDKTSWDIVAKVEKEMTSLVKEDVLAGAFKYVYRGKTYELSEEPKIVYVQNQPNSASEYVITDTWGASSAEDGLKFSYTGKKIPLIDDVYQGTISWSLRDVIE